MVPKSKNSVLLMCVPDLTKVFRTGYLLTADSDSQFYRTKMFGW